LSRPERRKIYEFCADFDCMLSKRPWRHGFDQHQHVARSQK